jgi:hypothetical protein
VKGSTTAFAALLDRMLAKVSFECLGDTERLLQDKIAIARMTPRINSPPRFVALIPAVRYLRPRPAIAETVP